ncbi:MAG: hypothetical protein UU73_C0001G0136 [Candidatus Daviesbacteria bacterium GW2011_GWA1_41_61]|uniref:Glycosyltransferase RgtA/B/C/D-like domain-containing protein n=1 Tax=Candidatus Daviesbacteria bacterium GW2011_GWA2_40_9 TaxID=1618424 RepID=A0A0G0WFF6_9BACT|nr:MAG: hypothetical protein UU26_C0001G0029 [Candidatus Daviesbacteria bacterium GW2011_GWC1_40_9]KKR83030.1 MAG: hypothetical protein UU29_C0008G0139 [Candidatus Daviesbacteria bacterium GW2011_GWA2_40_9]KKR92955.1 MAG: hypothetical protein UU44_C0004G0137 [Candidatus Daviesbacteria bacterium GW2011_GWB1_41_15]KKS15499.1 MAG: hypothetical protein UU73_C0001G0136 [Candidatus Daviesbacteria bacterium GW2011_GWA1_41_61]
MNNRSRLHRFALLTKRYKVVLALLFLLPWLLFSDTIHSYFSQDDFFHLRVVMDKNYQDIPSFFFSLQKEYAFYRPLSRETFNLLMYRSFGLNPLPFHLVNLLLVMIGGWLVFLVAQKLTKSSLTSLLAVVLYLFNSIHSIELYYLASVQTLLALLFLLLSLLFYLSSDDSLKKYLLSLSFFVLGLLSHEISIVMIGIIFCLEVTINNLRVWDKRLVKRLLPFAVIGLFYLASTSLFNRLPDQPVYQPVLSVKSMINTLSWYTLWVAGMPEFVVDFIGPKLTVNPNLMKWYGNFFRIALPTFLVGGLAITYFLVIFKNQLLKSNIFWFVALSYFISLLPFIFFPQHKSSYYLTLASVWFSILLALPLSWALEKQKVMKVFSLLAIIAFIVISYQTINLNKITYWAAKRASAAHVLLADVKEKYPSVDKGAVFYIKNDSNYPFIAKEWGSSSKQAFYILSGSDAFKLLFGDPTIQVYFEEMHPFPPSINKGKVIIYTAKFPY